MEKIIHFELNVKDFELLENTLINKDSEGEQNFTFVKSKETESSNILQ